MKLRHEHSQNQTTFIEAGVFFLINHGEVVFVGHSDNILWEIDGHFEKDCIQFTSFSWIEIKDIDEARWLAKEYSTLYGV
jgi:hypothetical protein